MASIESLDLDEPSVLYLAHHSDPSATYMFDAELIRQHSTFLSNLIDSDSSTLNNKDSPIVIPIGTAEAFQVFVKLFQTISDGTYQAHTLPKPIKRGSTLEQAYGPHYQYFDHLVAMARPEQFRHLREVNALANYFNIEFILVESLAILAFHYTHAENMDEWTAIKTLSNSFYTTSDY